MWRKRSWYRRINQTNLEDMTEIAGNGQNQGYRWLHRRAVQRGYAVSQDTIRQLIKLLDPEGGEQRRVRRLRRRQLKPFGRAISGCIDGFSRYIVWMEADPTKQRPESSSRLLSFITSRLGGPLERLHPDKGTVSADRGANFVLVLTLFSKCQDLSRLDISWFFNFILEIPRFKSTTYSMRDFFIPEPSVQQINAKTRF